MLKKDPSSEAKSSEHPALPLGPRLLEVSPHRLRAGLCWCQTIAVSGYPREVAPGWLTPLLSYPGPIDVSLHVEPIPNDLAAERMKRQRARFESTLRADAGKGRIPDPEIEAAAADAKQMMSDLATGEGRLFRLGLYITVRAASEEELAAEVGKVKAPAQGLNVLSSWPGRSSGGGLWAGAAAGNQHRAVPRHSTSTMFRGRLLKIMPEVSRLEPQRTCVRSTYIAVFLGL